MALSLNKPKLDNLANEIWKSAERLRGKFKAYEYQSVILPIIVIRRLECVLLAWRDAKSAEVLAKRPQLTEDALAKLVKESTLAEPVGAAPRAVRQAGGRPRLPGPRSESQNRPFLPRCCGAIHFVHRYCTHCTRPSCGG